MVRTALLLDCLFDANRHSNGQGASSPRDAEMAPLLRGLWDAGVGVLLLLVRAHAVCDRRDPRDIQPFCGSDGVVRRDSLWVVDGERISAHPTSIPNHRKVNFNSRKGA